MDEWIPKIWVSRPDDDVVIGGQSTKYEIICSSHFVGASARGM